MTAMANPPIHTFQDILDAIRWNPELGVELRQHLQDEELRNLPQTVALLAENLQQVTAAMQAMAERQDRMEADIIDIKALLAHVVERQDRMEADIVDIKALLAHVVERQDRMETDIVDIKALLAHVVERQDRMEADIVELKAGQTQSNERLGRLEVGQTQSNERLGRLEVGQTQSNERLGRLEVGQTQSNERLGRLEVGQTQSNERLGRLEVGQTQSNERLGRLEVGQTQSNERLGRLEAGQRRMEGRMGTITGTDYERRIARHFRSIANRYLALRRPQVLHSINNPQADGLAQTVEDAAESGVITHEANFDLDLADIIGCGENRQGDLLYVVAEVSETIDEYDISRALERADTVSRATGHSTLAVVIGRDISDANRRLSDRRRVSVVILDTETRPEPASPDA